MLLVTYYASNYVGIIGLGLPDRRDYTKGSKPDRWPFTKSRAGAYSYNALRQTSKHEVWSPVFNNSDVFW